MFLANLKLRTKLYIGFSAVLFLFVLTVAVGYLGMQNNKALFTGYSNIATEKDLAANIQSNLLYCRIAFKTLVETGAFKSLKEPKDTSQEKIFNDKYNQITTLYIQYKIIVKDDTRKKNMAQIIKELESYKVGFKDVIAVNKQKNDIFYNKLSIIGNDLEEKISSIVDKAYKSKNQVYTYEAYEAQIHILKGRLNSAKYMESGNSGYIETVKSEFLKVDSLLKSLQNYISDSKTQKTYNYVISQKSSYYSYFLALIETIIKEQSDIKKMDSIGPNISKIIFEVEDSISTQQKMSGPKVDQNNRDSIFVMLVMAFGAIFISIFISMWIVRIITKPVNTVANTFLSFSQGEANFLKRIDNISKDEIGQMSKHFNKFMDKLQIIFDDINKQSFIKTGLTELNTICRGENETLKLCEYALNYFCKFTDSQIGAIYLLSNNSNYKMVSTYAFESDKRSVFEIAAGEGLVGQCILEKKVLKVLNVPEDYIKINSGIGYSVPQNIIIIPGLLNEEVVCVLELGSFGQYQEGEIEFLEKATENLAISLNSSMSRIKLQELLEKTMEQSEELQMQQEELRQSNEELEEQTRALMETEYAMTQQQEELRQTNEQLEEQTNALKYSEACLTKQQEELKNANDGLEERTRMLEAQKQDIFHKNEVLRTAHNDIEEKAKALEVASKYKSEFLANMSHELRTPLNSILVLSQLLSNRRGESPLTVKELEFAKTINSAGTDLLSLINDVLDLSKVEAGKMDILIEKLKITDIVDFVERNFAEIATKKGLDFSAKIAVGIPNIFESDSLRLQQIIKNLLSNAFKFTSSGSVHFVIRRPIKDEIEGSGLLIDNSLCFSITDTGVGIPENKQMLIFEAFKQSDGTTSRKYGGTGLGLSISKDLAKLLGGKINISSKESKGSTFSLIIPEIQLNHQKNSSVLDKVIDNSQLPKPEASEIKNEIIEGQKVQEPKTIDDDRNNLDNIDKRLLIIEDDSTFNKILADMAKKKDFRCLIAENGKDGIDLAKKYSPDGIILDIGLPDMSGWSVIEELKKSSETRNIPVHVISGQDDQGFKVDNNIIGFLKKPVDNIKLDSILNDLKININKSPNKMIIVGKDVEQSNAIGDLFQGMNVITKTMISGEEALKLLSEEAFDCIVIDFELSDMTVFHFLDRVKRKSEINIPIIIYTGKEITENEEIELNKFADSIIIRGPKSKNRLFEEATLFLHRVDRKISSTKKPQKWSVKEKDSRLKNRKILLVDDDMRNVFALSSVLEAKGINVIIGKNGKEGIEKLEANKDISLILMDIMMPEMDGYIAMKKIRVADKWSNIPIIALTAKAMKEDRNKCIEAGANDYLTKPVDVEKLISLLRVWMYK